MPAGAQDNACAFCTIAQGDCPAHRVYESASALAFLDQRPLFQGHTLLVPREHFEALTNLPAELVEPLFTAAQLLARAIERAMEAQGTFIAINNRVSQSVPHLHVHIVPRRKGDGLRGFFWPRRKYESEQRMAEVAELIRAAVRDVM